MARHVTPFFPPPTKKFHDLWRFPLLLCMLFHIPLDQGLLRAVELLYAKIGSLGLENPRVLYFNSSNAETLRQALQTSPEPWTRDPEATLNFEYKRILSVLEILPALETEFDLLVVEQLDAIMQEHSNTLYGEQNAAVARLMRLSRDVVFLDSWPYLDTYYSRAPIATSRDT